MKNKKKEDKQAILSRRTFLIAGALTGMGISMGLANPVFSEEGDASSDVDEERENTEDVQNTDSENSEAEYAEIPPWLLEQEPQVCLCQCDTTFPATEKRGLLILSAAALLAIKKG